MKNNTSIKTLLGLTQKEMAMLLGVGQSLYSMFESGQRNLPPHATQKLEELLAQTQPAAQRKSSAKIEDHAQWLPYIESLLKENQYQILVTDKKIAALEKKHDATERRLLLNESLSKNDKAIPILSAKIAKQARRDPATDLMKLQLKREWLKVESEFLQTKLTQRPKS